MNNLLHVHLFKRWEHDFNVKTIKLKGVACCAFNQFLVFSFKRMIFDVITE